MRCRSSSSCGSGFRLSVVVLTICSACLTIQTRSNILSTSTFYAAARSKMTSVALAVAEAEDAEANLSSAPAFETGAESAVVAPAEPALISVPALSETLKPRVASVGRRANATERSQGWRRTLPPSSEATVFEHERTLPEIYADVPVGGTVWLTFANSAFQQFAINWAAHVYRLEKQRHMAIAALDTPFQQRLLSEGLPYFAHDHGLTGDLRSSVTEFRRLGALKGALVLQVLRAERRVLLSDVDVIWMSDPTSVLGGLSLHADVMSATDCLHVTDDEAKFPVKDSKGTNRCAYNPGDGEGHAAFNTGVVYFRPSTAAKAFAAAWRRRLLSVEKSAWLDDQLAFNELVWHGYRNHPSRAVRAASPDGRTIWVRMGRAASASSSPSASALSSSSAAAAAAETSKSHFSAELEDIPNGCGHGGSEAACLPTPDLLPAWTAGWRDLVSKPDEAFAPPPATTNGSRRVPKAIPAMPTAYKLAPLPARFFCSGHLFWEQQGLQRRDCMSVHTTFVEGGNAGKLWRFRDAGLWLLEPPSHFEPTPNARYLLFDPPKPPSLAELAPLINQTRCPRYAGTYAPCPYTDKYKAGWLVPDALAMSPRLRQHLELVRRHILALRDALALALVLDRILILPRIPCLCDRSEGPLVLQQCRYEASELPTVFICPLTHIFDIVRFASISPDMTSSWRDGGTTSLRPRFGVATVTFRESSFLDNPLTPLAVRTNHTRVRVAMDSAAMRLARASGEAAILRGTSAEQAVAALGAAGGMWTDAPVLHFESTEGVFGGFVDPRQRASFESMIASSGMLTGSWCCSSWYKPSGSIEYVAPKEVPILPGGCGTASPFEAASDRSDPSSSPTECVQLGRAHTRATRGPAKLEYVLKMGREGVDGYYGLKAPREYPPHAFETCPISQDDQFGGTLSTCCQSPVIPTYSYVHHK